MWNKQVRPLGVFSTFSWTVSEHAEKLCFSTWYGLTGPCHVISDVT